jgi:hypothetical protein
VIYSQWLDVLTSGLVVAVVAAQVARLQGVMEAQSLSHEVAEETLRHMISSERRNADRLRTERDEALRQRWAARHHDGIHLPVIYVAHAGAEFSSAVLGFVICRKEWGLRGFRVYKTTGFVLYALHYLNGSSVILQFLRSFSR